MNLEAGSVSIALADLVEELAAHGVSGEIIECVNDGDVLDRVRRADVVHLHGVDGPFSFGLADAARRCGRPYIVSLLGSFCDGAFERTGWWKRRRLGSRRLRLLSNAAAVGVLDQSEAAAIRRSTATGKILELPYGLQFERYSREGDYCSSQAPDFGDARCMLYLGPIHPMEGLVPLLRAVAELGHDFQGWKLVLAGPEPGVWREKIEAGLVRKHALDRVAFVPNPDVGLQRALLARASVLVSPSLAVRCPVSVVQGVATGVPVVASAHGLDATVADAVCVCRSEGAALRDALRPLVIRDHEALCADGSSVRAVLRRYLDVRAAVGRYVDLYASSLG